jgi:hypothetical protein
VVGGKFEEFWWGGEGMRVFWRRRRDYESTSGFFFFESVTSPCASSNRELMAISRCSFDERPE